jgi:hypothetical protein
MATVAELQQTIASLQTQLAQVTASIANPATLPAVITLLNAEQARLQAQLAVAEQELATALAAPKTTPQPSATAAQTAQDDAPSGPTAVPQQTVGPGGRVVTPTNTGASNAEAAVTQQNAAGATTGTNSAVKTTEQTQAITTASNSGSTLTGPTNAANSSPVPTNATPVISAGVGAAKDDNTPAATAQAAVDASSTAEPNVKPRPNVLDQYASYTYSASVYLLTEPQYTRLLTSAAKSVDGYQLLFQSGGAANNVGGFRPSGSFEDTAPGTIDGGRNPYFDNDFYIDRISIENLPPGKATGSAHNISSMKFTLVEPNGITLLDRLYDAVANSAPKSADGKVNYTAATYLMVIRFYGYDSEGNLEQVRSKPDQEGTSDPASIIEKFVPFRIKSINWSVGSKLVSYDWECVPIGQMIAGFASRGTIPYDVQLVDSTVGGLLGGDVAYSNATAGTTNPGASTTSSLDASGRRNATSDPRVVGNRTNLDASGRRNATSDPRVVGNQTNLDASGRRNATSDPRVVGNQTNGSAPPKVNAAPSSKKTITKGLVGAMNEFQKKLVKDGVFTYADEYVVNFIGPDANKIKDARLQLPNAKVVKRLTAAGKTPTQDAQNLDQARTSVDMISRSFSITAGQQLLQAIELTIRNSSYIYDQAVVIINPDGTQIPNPNSRNKPLKWFVITMSAEKISPTLDPKRNDYAYRITYSIAAREVKNMISKYFPVSRFSGVHKSYPYWFTGQNTAVLDYAETLNAMYQLTVSGSDTEDSAATRTRQQFTSSMADIVTYNYAPRSTESSHGASGKENELGANAAEVLYSPGDLREAKVKIVGDPAWIMQGSNFRLPTSEYFSGTSLSTGFLPDGSIAFDNQDVLFEIAWQRPEDYDIETGIADPYSQTQQKYNNRTALQSRVYLCKRVHSEFRQGRFEQTLEGALYLFPVPNKSNTANPAAANKAISNTNASTDNSSNRVETAKLLRQAQGTRPSLPATGAVGGSSSPQFASTDPRRLDIGDGGKAAILGAQQNAVKVPVLSTTGQGTVPGGQSYLPGQLGSGTYSILPAPVPGLPTSGAGGLISSVPATVSRGPAKLPSVPMRTLADARRERVPGSPVSSESPTDQKISRET